MLADPDIAPVCEQIVAGWDRPAVIVTSRDGGGLTLEALIAGHAPDALPPPAPDDDAVFQYSSGSTGRPKRLARTHAGLRAEADSFHAAAGAGDADVLLCAVPLFHSYVRVAKRATASRKSSCS